MTPGDLCDLILVFFDPMGQALCKRTLNIVESLNEKHGDRLRFYLSKADEAGGESDRQVLSCPPNSFVEKWQSGSTFKVSFKSVPQRVMMQIVQELCKRPGLNKCGFDMPTIYIPNPNKVRALLLAALPHWTGLSLCSFSTLFLSVHSQAAVWTRSKRCVAQLRGLLTKPSRIPWTPWRRTVSLSAMRSRRHLPVIGKSAFIVAMMKEK